LFIVSNENAGPENARPKNAAPENEGSRRIWILENELKRGCKMSGLLKAAK